MGADADDNCSSSTSDDYIATGKDLATTNSFSSPRKLASPQRRRDRTPRKTPPSQSRSKKSLRLASSHDESNGIIPAINADIMQGNTDLGQSGDLDGDGSINLPRSLEDFFGSVAINIECNNTNTASPESETADMYSALQLLGDALEQSHNILLQVIMDCLLLPTK